MTDKVDGQRKRAIQGLQTDPTRSAEARFDLPSGDVVGMGESPSPAFPAREGSHLKCKGSLRPLLRRGWLLRAAKGDEAHDHGLGQSAHR